MGRRRKYDSMTSDKLKVDEEKIDGTEYPLLLDNPRKYSGGDADGSEFGASMSLLFERSIGDWSWKPCYPDLPFTGETRRARERQALCNQIAQGTPRPTTRFTLDGRIAQTAHIPRPVTGHAPRPMGSTMKPVWDQINDRR